MATIRLTQIDGSLPNLALMKLSHFFRSTGNVTVVTRCIHRGLFEPEYDQVYGSAIFRFSRTRLEHFTRQWPGAIVGGTGTTNPITVEQIIGYEYEHYDYSGWPDFDQSLGFTQRGCRMKCKFCVVPQKEGTPRSVNTISDIWRGAPWPKKLHLLDNDFFGQPKEAWRERIREIRDGGFRICLSQGVNVRRLDPESAAALASIEYRDTKFKVRRLYTAWDNLRDEEVFFRGVKTLAEAGVPAKHLRAYMLVGFDIVETWDRIWHRFNRMVQLGIEPYPMVYDRERKDLLAFQRWVVMGLYRRFPFDLYDDSRKSPASVEAFIKRGWYRGPINP
jgi:hypothetical protein